MDYESIYGPGISNFSSSSPHRLPTQTAADAYQEHKTSRTRCIATSLPLLDCALQNRELATDDTEPFFGGVSRGKVTEIYGPPGVGKTTIGIQLAANALYAGERVTWVSGHRLSQILSAPRPDTSNHEDGPDVQTIYERLSHFSTPTLAHFIALFSESGSSQMPSNTSLIIIDSFSTLIACAFPRNADSNTAPRKPGESNPSARRFAIIQSQISILSKLAGARNIAIVILSQCVTKMRSGAGAVLAPALNTKSWDEGLAARIALFKDFGWEDEDGKDIKDVRFAQVLKAEGSLVPEGRSKLVGFSIVESGLYPIKLPVMLVSTLAFRSPMKRSPHPLSHAQNQSPVSTPDLPMLPQKRKFEDTGFEIPDSDDEDYGWDQDDEEELPPPPPQWQGSEDVLGPGMDPGEEEEGFEKDEELDELAGTPSAGEEAEDDVTQEHTGGIRRSSATRAKVLSSPIRRDSRSQPGFADPGILSKTVPSTIRDSDSEDELAA